MQPFDLLNCLWWCCRLWYWCLVSARRQSCQILGQSLSRPVQHHSAMRLSLWCLSCSHDWRRAEQRGSSRRLCSRIDAILSTPLRNRTPQRVADKRIESIWIWTHDLGTRIQGISHEPRTNSWTWDLWTVWKCTTKHPDTWITDLNLTPSFRRTSFRIQDTVWTRLSWFGAIWPLEFLAPYWRNQAQFFSNLGNL